MKKVILCLFLGTFITACSYIISSVEDETYDVLNVDKKSLSILISGNINGETHPCGCRHFPLGGLPQVAGLFHDVKKKSDIIYIDAGDTLFPAAVLPDFTAESLKYGALNLAKGLDKVGLKYMVPGDQDFAAGIDFLKEVAGQVSFKFLISNLKDPKTMPHKEWVKIEEGPHKIFLVGLVEPSVLRGKWGSYFTQPETALLKTIEVLKKNGFKPNDKFHRLIVVHHAGIDLDEKLASKVNNIDFVAGAHSMSFTKFPLKENGAQLVQVLSRNHYIGQIKISLDSSQEKDKFEILEIREDLIKKLNPNPFIEFIDRHKQKLSEIRTIEQAKFNVVFKTAEKIQTSTSCLECHTQQGRFWQKTPHSLAYITLVNAGEENNLACVKCHSLELGNKNAFKTKANIVQYNEHITKLSKDKIKAHDKKYWAEFKKSFGKIKSVRKLSSEKLMRYSNKWIDLDEKYKVEHNYSNVQCLNCHDQHTEHPFEGSKQPVVKTARMEKIKSSCLKCHDPDQSPQWYQTLKNGQAGALDEYKFLKTLKKMSCPEKTL